MIKSVYLSFYLFVCEQDYYKSNEQISLKLGVMIGPTNPKNWLTLGYRLKLTSSSNIRPRMRILDHFSNFLYHCKIQDFRRFISISHTVIGRFLRHSAK